MMIFEVAFFIDFMDPSSRLQQRNNAEDINVRMKPGSCIELITYINKNMVIISHNTEENEKETFFSKKEYTRVVDDHDLDGRNTYL